METGKSGLESMYTERYAACFELYLQHGGRNFLAIERGMRELGYDDFHRRILYTRKERGIEKPGWIEKFGWRRFLPTELREESGLSVPPALAGGAFSPRITTPPATAGGTDKSAPDFPDWLKQVSPELTWDWPYQKYIYKHLQRVTDGTCKRLMIFMPPRHGKSELVTVRYAGWRLWNDPKMKIIVSSYNQKLADRFSRSIRKLLGEEEDIRAAGSPPYQGVAAPASGDGVVLAPRRKRQRASRFDSCQPCGEPLRQQETLPPLLRQGGEKQRPLPSLSEEGWQPDAFDPADGVVTVPSPIQAAEIEARIRQSCDHPQCAADASHHSETANRNSQIARMFPRISRTINTASQWETALGGGVKAVGVGAGVTGFGGQLIVIDDPVKSRAEAESETYRERLWDWYRNDLYTRLEPGAAVILIQTRWHQDDLAGRLLSEMQTGGDSWEVIDLPALSEQRAVATGLFFNAETQSRGEKGEDSIKKSGSISSKEFLTPSNPPRLRVSALKNPSDPLGRPVGAALCPDRFDETKLADIRRQLGGYNFAALYQQHPTPAEGGIFKRAWFTRFVDRAPEGLKWKRGYDLAVSTKTNSCFTASFRVARDEATGNVFIADGFRERIEYPDQKRFVIDRLMAERDTEHGIEKALHGQALIQELRRETRLFGKNLRGIDVTVDKVTRALTWAPLAEEGKVILVTGGWNRAFLDELANFPSGRHDDQIDAVSLAVSMLAAKGGKVWSF